MRRASRSTRGLTIGSEYRKDKLTLITHTFYKLGKNRSHPQGSEETGLADLNAANLANRPGCASNVPDENLSSDEVWEGPRFEFNYFERFATEASRFCLTPKPKRSVG